MSKYTTKQLQDALMGLYVRNDADAKAAYEMVFDELCSRMGDEQFMAWCDKQGI